MAALAWEFGRFVRCLAGDVVIVAGLCILAVARPVGRRSRRHSDENAAGESVRQRLAELQQIVDQTQSTEAAAQARYDAVACPLEDVIRARAMRWKAEIDLIRFKRAQHVS